MARALVYRGNTQCGECQFDTRNRRSLIKHVWQHFSRQYCSCGFNAVSRDMVLRHQRRYRLRTDAQQHGGDQGRIYKVDEVSYPAWCRAVGFQNPPLFRPCQPTLSRMPNSSLIRRNSSFSAPSLRTSTERPPSTLRLTRVTLCRRNTVTSTVQPEPSTGRLATQKNKKNRSPQPKSILPTLSLHNPENQSPSIKRPHSFSTGNSANTLPEPSVNRLVTQRDTTDLSSSVNTMNLPPLLDGFPGAVVDNAQQFELEFRELEKHLEAGYRELTRALSVYHKLRQRASYIQHVNLPESSPLD